MRQAVGRVLDSMFDEDQKTAEGLLKLEELPCSSLISVWSSTIGGSHDALCLMDLGADAGVFVCFQAHGYGDDADDDDDDVVECKHTPWEVFTLLIDQKCWRVLPELRSTFEKVLRSDALQNQPIAARWFREKFGDTRSKKRGAAPRSDNRAKAVSEALALTKSAIHIRAVQSHLVRFEPSPSSARCLNASNMRSSIPSSTPSRFLSHRIFHRTLHRTSYRSPNTPSNFPSNVPSNRFDQPTLDSFLVAEPPLGFFSLVEQEGRQPGQEGRVKRSGRGRAAPVVRKAAKAKQEWKQLEPRTAPPSANAAKHFRPDCGHSFHRLLPRQNLLR